MLGNADMGKHGCNISQPLLLRQEDEGGGLSRTRLGHAAEGFIRGIGVEGDLLLSTATPCGDAPVAPLRRHHRPLARDVVGVTPLRSLATTSPRMP
jgi:hypothetical protein